MRRIIGKSLLGASIFPESGLHKAAKKLCKKLHKSKKIRKLSDLSCSDHVETEVSRMRSLTKLGYLLLVISLLVLGLYMLLPDTFDRATHYMQIRSSAQRYTTEDRLNQFGAAVTQRIQPYFAQAQAPFPLQAIRLLAFKDSKQVELYAPDMQGAWTKIHSYPIQAASGVLGPKLREGDRQVPEGIYHIESLNPNSLFHVALRLNYPNAFDQEMGAQDQRSALGSDIMIHGQAKSIGCLAMGDLAAEELFALTAWAGKENVQVLIAPIDLRQTPVLKVAVNAPSWVMGLYDQLAEELQKYP